MKITTIKKINYQDKLNPEQLKVVLEGDGPCLVLSGPGSGKTRTLVYRTAYLLEKGVPPSNILLVTFTKKAAKEMLNRIESLLGCKPGRLWGGTFHHIGNLILQRYADKLDYRPDYKILDQKDSEDLISIVFQEMMIKEINEDFPQPKVVQKIISLCLNSGKTIKEIIEELFPYWGEEGEEPNMIFWMNTIWKNYIKKKKEQNLIDYDDLLIKWLELLKKFPDIQKRLSFRFKYILVDEYQDVNSIQDEIIEKMAKFHQNVMAVGDDSQSIYSFRGVDVKYILNFSRKYQDVKTFKLETNYRSTPGILNLANEVISQNKQHLAKTLRSVKKDDKLPTLAALKDPDEEAEFIAQKILDLQNEKVPFSEIAVLFRARYQSVRLELELNRKNIPYVIRGGLRFFEQAHVKDLLAFLKILVNFQDELAWERILKYQEGIGIKYARQIFEEVNQSKKLQDLFKEKTVNKFKQSLSRKAFLGFKKIIRLLQRIDEIYSRREKNYIEKIVLYILENWYKDFLQKSYPDAKERIEDSKQLANLSTNYSEINTMLSSLVLSEEFKGGRNLLDDGKIFREAVTLSTIHQAKGLEWKIVFVVSLKEGEFPHTKSLADENSLEEERRIFYVAVTRCAEKLYLTYPVIHYRHGSILTEASRFIEEINQNLFEKWRITEESSVNDF